MKNKVISCKPFTYYFVILDLPYKTYKALLKPFDTDVRLFSVESADGKLGLCIPERAVKNATDTANDLIKDARLFAKTEAGMKSSHKRLLKLVNQGNGLALTNLHRGNYRVAIQTNPNKFIFPKRIMDEACDLGIVALSTIGDDTAIGIPWEKYSISDNYFYWHRFINDVAEYNVTKKDDAPSIFNGGYPNLESLRKLKNDSSELVLALS